MKHFLCKVFFLAVIATGFLLMNNFAMSDKSTIGYFGSDEVRKLAERTTKATAAEEQSAAAEQISRSVDQIANVTHEAAKGAAESAFASEDLNNQAESLSQLVSQFKV